jgi:sulfite reductase beta subunit-like hemoprotein
MLAEVALHHGGGFLLATCDQDIALIPVSAEDADAARSALACLGFDGTSREERVVFRICPGNHECRLGLAPTRDVARDVLAAMGSAGEGLTWAISGCPNSCSQPQLAQMGIVTTRFVAGDDGERRPLFDLYRRQGGGLGTAVERGLDLDGLVRMVTADD